MKFKENENYLQVRSVFSHTQKRWGKLVQVL